MKAYVVQPAYCLDFSESDKFFEWEIDALDSCGEDADLIILPEYSNVPCLAKTKEEMLESYNKYSERLLTKASETAKRCSATLFVNCIYPTDTGLRNTTVAFNKEGEIAGKYFKQHLVPSEMYTYELDKDYTWESSEPTVIEIDGVRYGFLICYDFYFYEAFANMARYDPDVIIACAYQRSDTHDALEILSRFCAYNCNAYVVRSSVSLGADSPVGGCSMVVAPDGRVLLNMKNEVGVGVTEFDPHAHYLKAAGFGNPPATHHSYIEDGRRPWKYRIGGPAMVRDDEIMTYPRICAQRGFWRIAPENTMPALGAAVSMGAREIEFDVWTTKDGVPVAIHYTRLETASNGEGLVTEHTYEELLQLDFGSIYSSEFAGLKIASLEDILKKFAGQVVMNVHIKNYGNDESLSDSELCEIIRLVHKYDCKKYVYFTANSDAVLMRLAKLAPSITRCVGADKKSEDIISRAILSGAKKIQIYTTHLGDDPDVYLRNTILRAHENGIIVNLFECDDADDAKKYFDMGVDTILTNNYHKVSASAEGRDEYLFNSRGRRKA